MDNLKKTLILNFLFSFSTGAALLLWHERVAEWFDVTQSAYFIYLGLALVVFSGTVLWEVKKQRVSYLWTILIQDSIWVLACVVLLIFRFLTISPIGYWLIGLSAIPVAFFAFFQFKSLQRLRKGKRKEINNAV